MKNQLKTLKIIHLALVAGLVLAYVVIGDLTHLDNIKMPTIGNNELIYALIPLFAFLLSNFMFKKLITKIDRQRNLAEQFPTYLSATIVRYAIIEGAAFLILVLKPDFILFGIVLIVYLALLMPTESRIKKDLEHLV